MRFSKVWRIQKIHDGQYLALIVATLAKYDFLGFFFCCCFLFVCSLGHVIQIVLTKVHFTFTSTKCTFIKFHFSLPGAEKAQMAT